MGPCIGVMAGGTGGHVFPALAVAERLRAEGARVFWIGTRRGMESRLVPEHGFEIEWLGIEGVRGKGWRSRVLAPWRLARASWQAARILRRRRPALVLGMGGFVSGPGGVMARVLGIPLVVQEQNRVPGLTNQWLSRIARRVFEGFPGSFAPGRAEVSGNPVRAEIAALPTPAARWRERDGAARLLVLGGSLGALALNRTLAPALARLAPEMRPLVRHQAGTRTLEEARAAYREAGVEAEVVPFIDDMAAAYAWADLVVCRAGALTVSELAAAGVGAVLVPYPHAVDDHQRANAGYLVEAGAARLLPQTELTAERLGELLAELLGDRAALLAMAEAARGRARPEAAARIAARCLEEIGR
ncbi:undecaprenyldiphospho-muramoylpentapeptide beta-N-acetylglucosaminyltransferase [Marichromatium gracile]|uniref:UDP-N-acetylglucosamine--N-acetylmuramyl-(pentapeptide) pyrophosphoryl-undecaprenol N-acetylglucosamine transferase n=1 Tax=Marichromatium gracile TaxID=1048 RepID=A0A4R4AGW6_MARGR|nr:undecaprenyldiphospho-muramoylpentapeptide beta-N-acetylglucosaminyltransferase [Marichromatium gracile]MBK1709288.1 undecaprenyldiphospho-muramoylpentapeptide beta-N-acetylglucosaminyltransferase [Marichromatium gracile]TCW38204.1 UDP-N-acetylglucosamine-N-acetylmuramylpentapeptide N-acetylglucosamine transferase [Marichromatium gracile]